MGGGIGDVRVATSLKSLNFRAIPLKSWWGCVWCAGWSENSSDITAGWSEWPFLHCVNGKKSLWGTPEKK